MCVFILTHFLFSFCCVLIFFFFFFNDTATTEIYTLSLHDALPILTNGYLVDKQVTRKMKETGMSSIVVSIDGLGKTHDGLRQKDGSYEKAIEAVKILAKVDSIKALQITTTLNKNNFDELEKMYETFLGLGITSWREIGRASCRERV